MEKGKRFKILEHLPPYGSMYVPVSDNGEFFYSEGFVVEFIKNDGKNWIANFKTGWTDYSYIQEFKDDKILIIAYGQGYLMNPNFEKPIDTFGISIKEVLQFEDEKVITSDDIGITIIDSSGIIWTSPRISWDGIKDLKLEGKILTGKSFDPMNDTNEWVGFKINLETKEVEGGSYRIYYTDEGISKKQPWWKRWIK